MKPDVEVKDGKEKSYIRKKLNTQCFNHISFHEMILQQVSVKVILADTLLSGCGDVTGCQGCDPHPSHSGTNFTSRFKQSITMFVARVLLFLGVLLIFIVCVCVLLFVFFFSLFLFVITITVAPLLLIHYPQPCSGTVFIMKILLRVATAAPTHLMLGFKQQLKALLRQLRSPFDVGCWGGGGGLGAGGGRGDPPPPSLSILSPSLSDLEHSHRINTVVWRLTLGAACSPER